MYKEVLGMNYIHADLLFNLAALVDGNYRPRIWNVIPYVHTGFYNTYYKEGGLYDAELSSGVGFLNTFKLIEGLNLLVDFRANVLKSNSTGKPRDFSYSATALAGLSYDMGMNTNWLPVDAYAKFRQAHPNLDHRGRRKRLVSEPPFIAGNIWDNIFINLSGGMTMLTEDRFSRAGYTPTFDITVGKWFSPWFGLRAGVQGMSMKEYTPDHRYRFSVSATPEEHGGEMLYKGESNYYYLHTDFLWNLYNTLAQYQREWIWNLIPYTHFGVMQNFYRETGVSYKREYAWGLGLINTFKVGRHTNLFLDLRTNFLENRVTKRTTAGAPTLLSSAQIGMTYEIGKNYWMSYKDAPKSYMPVLNKISENFFVSIAGGINTMAEGGLNIRGYNGMITGGYDVAVGKWFSPEFGGRLGYQGGKLSEWIDAPREGISTTPGQFRGENKYKADFTYGYIHGDILWNALNTFIGYDEGRIYHVIPYYHTGFFSANQVDRLRERASGIGVINQFCLTPQLGLYVDLRVGAVKAEIVKKPRDKSFFAGLYAGVSYNIGKSVWHSARRLNTPAVRRETEGEDGEGPFISGALLDNIFVSVAGGVNTLWEPHEGSLASNIGATPGFDIAVGKWFSPEFGMRLGFQGATLTDYLSHPRYRVAPVADSKGRYKMSVRFNYIHNDFLWNVNDTFQGYKKKRVWSLIPYTHFGVVNSTYSEGGGFKREYAWGLGLINKFRLGENSSIFIDLRTTKLRSRSVKQDGGNAVQTSAFVGLAYALGKNWWRSWTPDGENKGVLLAPVTRNLFLTYSGGIAMQSEGGMTCHMNAEVTAGFDITFGKWFSPDFAGRIGYTSSNFSQWTNDWRPRASTIGANIGGYDMYRSSLTSHYFHTDLMWDPFTTFMGYDRDRFFSLYPYAHTGLMHNTTVKGDKFRREWAAGVGLMVSFRFDDEFSLFVDARPTCLKADVVGKYRGYAFAGYLSAGMAYDFGGKHWQKASEYEAGRKEENDYEKKYRNFAISTNMLSLAALGTVSAEFQYEIHRHVSLGAQMRFNPWTYNRGVEGQFQHNEQTFSFGAKYWPWYVYAGWWFGGSAQFQNYRNGGCFWDKTNEEGKAYGLGLSLGYSILLRKWLNVDIAIGGWGGYKDYVTYDNSRFQTAVGMGKKFFLAPNEVSVSAVFLF